VSPAVVNSISVSGTGEAQGAPDLAYIQLGIDVVNVDVSVALADANTLMTAIQDAIKGQGIDQADLQTVNFNVYPEDVYDPATGQPTGERRYHVSNFLNVKVRDISKISAVIDAGLGAGANNVSGLTFGVADTKALEDAARTKAIEDAKARAQALADGMGVKLGDVIVITEGGATPPILYDKVSMQGGLGGGGAVPVAPGQMTVSMTVNVTFTLVK
jgi:uncharacterized protein YggE